MKLSKLLSTSILIVLALLLSGAKPASPASKNPRTKQDQDQSSSQQHLPDAQQSIASSLAGLAKIAESIHRDAKIAYRQYQSDQNSYSSPTMVVQIVLAVVGLLYVGTALLQWRAINQQAKLMQANFDQWIDLTNWRCAEKMHELKIWVDLVNPTAFPMKFTGFVAIAEDKQDLGDAVRIRSLKGASRTTGREQLSAYGGGAIVHGTPLSRDSQRVLNADLEPGPRPGPRGNLHSP
jgi:hypothetical protein